MRAEKREKPCVFYNQRPQAFISLNFSPPENPQGIFHFH